MGSDLSPDAATPRIGELAGSAVARAADAAALELEKAGEKIMELAADIDVEAKTLAASLRSIGDRARIAIEGFTSQAQQTMQAMAAERKRIEALTDGDRR